MNSVFFQETFGHCNELRKWFKQMLCFCSGCDDDGDDDETASNESQVGEVCTSWVLLRHSIVAALGHLNGGDFDCW